MKNKEDHKDKSLYRKGGFVFRANHDIRTVSCPQSIEQKEYPEEVLKLIKDKKYYVREIHKS